MHGRVGKLSSPDEVEADGWKRRAVRLILALGGGGAKIQGIHEVEIILTRGSRARR